MIDKKNSQGQIVVQTMPISILLFITFLVLKLTGVIAWSWWFVTMPLWISSAILLGILLIGLVVFAGVAIIASIATYFTNKPKT
jgi:hypothetical protein